MTEQIRELSQEAEHKKTEFHTSPGQQKNKVSQISFQKYRIFIEILSIFIEYGEKHGSKIYFFFENHRNLKISIKMLKKVIIEILGFKK